MSDHTLTLPLAIPESWPSMPDWLPLCIGDVDTDAWQLGDLITVCSQDGRLEARYLVARRATDPSVEGKLYLDLRRDEFDG